tara:strand:- start:2985 stop:3668 length:684 start_codon:yes stop_codon:yes gene_type:complete
MKKRSKRYKDNKKKILNKTLSLNDAIKLFKSLNNPKFDETIDISIILNKEKQKGENLARGYSQLPNGTGKKIKVAVFASDEKVEIAKKAGADLVGNEDLIKDIKEGKINFDIVVSTPEMMKNIATLGEKLGPLGIMPNPKTGTVSDDLEKTIKNIKGGQIQFKSEKNGIVQAGIGKLSFSEDAIVNNFKEFINSVNKSKPDTIKGKFINKVFLSLSMGPSLRIENIK